MIPNTPPLATPPPTLPVPSLEEVATLLQESDQTALAEQHLPGMPADSPSLPAGDGDDDISKEEMVQAGD